MLGSTFWLAKSDFKAAEEDDKAAEEDDTLAVEDGDDSLTAILVIIFLLLIGVVVGLCLCRHYRKGVFKLTPKEHSKLDQIEVSFAANDA